MMDMIVPRYGGGPPQAILPHLGLTNYPYTRFCPGIATGIGFFYLNRQLFDDSGLLSTVMDDCFAAAPEPLSQRRMIPHDQNAA